MTGDMVRDRDGGMPMPELAVHANAWPSSGGEMGALIRAFDWSQTGLGPTTKWPQSLRTAVDILLQSPVPLVMLWGPDGIMLYNDAYSVFAGGRHPRLLGSKVLEGWPEVADFNANVMRVGLSGGTLAYRDQHLVLYRNGTAEDVWMNLDYSPVLDERGTPAGVLAIVVETTELVIGKRQLEIAQERERVARAEAELERRRLREMFEQAPAAIALLRGPDHVFQLANEHYVQIFGPQRTYLNRPIREVFADVEDASIWKLLDDVYATGEAFTGTEWMVELDRQGHGQMEETFHNFVFQPIRGESGGVDGIVIHAADVTPQVRARQVVEDALRARDEFLSIAAHELRTPITSIKMTAQLAVRTHARAEADPDRLVMMLQTIDLTANRLVTLTDDLLDVSRLQGGQLALRREHVDAVALVQGVLDRVSLQLGERHVLEVHLPEASISIEADAGRLEQVLDNLISNAIKYSPAGGVIQVGVRLCDGGVVISVADSGIGLPAGSIEQIFEPFGRATNAADRHVPGMGLGLYISRRLVEQHGGRISASSLGEGQGATFSVWLPVLED